MKIHPYLLWLLLLSFFMGCATYNYTENVDIPNVFLDNEQESSDRFRVIGLDSAPAVEFRAPLVMANVDHGDWVYRLQESPSIYLWISLSSNNAVIMDFMPDFKDAPIPFVDTLKVSLLKAQDFLVEPKQLSTQNGNQHPLTVSMVGDITQSLAVTARGNSQWLSISYNIDGGVYGNLRDLAEYARYVKLVPWYSGLLLCVMADVILSPVYLVGSLGVLLYCSANDCHLNLKW